MMITLPSVMSDLGYVNPSLPKITKPVLTTTGNITNINNYNTYTGGFLPYPLWLYNDSTYMYFNVSNLDNYTNIMTGDRLTYDFINVVDTLTADGFTSTGIITLYSLLRDSAKLDFLASGKHGYIYMNNETGLMLYSDLDIVNFSDNNITTTGHIIGDGSHLFNVNCSDCSGGNSSFNQSLTDILYYSIDNPLNFDNITTLDFGLINVVGDFEDDDWVMLYDDGVNENQRVPVGRFYTKYIKGGLGLNGEGNLTENVTLEINFSEIGTTGSIDTDYDWMVMYNSNLGIHRRAILDTLNKAFDHDILFHYEPNEHIDWTNTSEDLDTSGQIRSDGGFYSSMTPTDTSTFQYNSDFRPTSETNGTHYYYSTQQIQRVAVNDGVTDSGNAIGYFTNVLRNYNSGSSDDSGTLSNIFGVKTNVGHLNTNAGETPLTTNVYGFQNTPYAYTGTITNYYGLRLDSKLGTGTITNYYGIYQADSNADNYFAGDVGIGTSSPNAKLDVESDSFPTMRMTRTSTTTNSTKSSFELVHKTTGDATDGFGVTQVFSMQDTGMSDPTFLGYMGFKRGDADGYGDFYLYPYQSTGVSKRKSIQFTQNGELGINTDTPLSKLGIYSASVNDDMEMIKLVMPSWASSSGKHKNIQWSDVDYSTRAVASIGATFSSSKGIIDIHSLYNSGYKTDTDITMRIEPEKIGILTSSPSKTLDVNGDISLEAGSGDYYSNDGSQGWTGTFTNGDGDTVTVKNGIITDVN